MENEWTYELQYDPERKMVDTVLPSEGCQFSRKELEESGLETAFTNLMTAYSRIAKANGREVGRSKLVITATELSK